MSDDKSKQGTADDIRIDAKDASEVEYAAKQFGVSPEKVRASIAKVGNLRADVEKDLKGE
jgi:hypothetical protein